MDLVNFLVTVLVMGLVFALLYWLIQQFELPAPFVMVAKAVLALIAVLWLLGMLTGTVNMPVLKLK